LSIGKKDEVPYGSVIDNPFALKLKKRVKKKKKAYNKRLNGKSKHSVRNLGQNTERKQNKVLK
jgi:hypothetical protein